MAIDRWSAKILQNIFIGGMNARLSEPIPYTCWVHYRYGNYHTVDCRQSFLIIGGKHEYPEASVTALAKQGIG